MVDVPEFEGLGTSEDPTGLEAELRNSSLDACKDVLPYRRSSDDDDEDGGPDLQEGGGMGNHARVTIVKSARASDNPLSNYGGVSRHSGDEPLADKEGMEDDLVDYKSKLYESAMRDQAVAIDSIFCIQSHSQDCNTPLDKVCFLRFPLYYVGFSFFCSVLFPRGEDTCSCYAIFVVCLIFNISMIGIVRHKDLVVWMSLHRVLSLN